MQTCIAYVISPIHALSALSGILARHPKRDLRLTVVVSWPGGDDDFIKELTDLFTRMLTPFDFVEDVIGLRDSEILSALSQKYFSDLSKSVTKLTRLEAVDELYYPHDVVGSVYQILSTVYKSTRRICFGDSMGQVVERSTHLGHLGIKVPAKKKQSILEISKDWVNNRLYQHLGWDYKASIEEYLNHEAALILPVDQAGTELRDITVTVCPRHVVLEVLDTCMSACKDLSSYISSLVKKYDGRQKYLLLTENGAEGNFINFEKEVDMYCSVIRKNCVQGSVLFLKSHPAESLPRNEAIAERLGRQLEIVNLKAEYKRYPIEFWRELVLNATVICMSYPVLSLKYLYGIDVIQPMDDVFIERWFPEWTWKSYKNALQLYMEPLKRLSTWDGKSVLWSGNAIN